MTVIPNFLLKRIYIAGSLRQEPEGVAFDLKNVIGPGLIMRVNHILLDDARYEAGQIHLRKNAEQVSALEITDKKPFIVSLDETITCLIENLDLPAGQHRITLDVTTKEAGKVAVTVEDRIS